MWASTASAARPALRRALAPLAGQHPLRLRLQGQLQGAQPSVLGLPGEQHFCGTLKDCPGSATPAVQECATASDCSTNYGGPTVCWDCVADAGSSLGGICYVTDAQCSPTVGGVTYPVQDGRCNPENDPPTCDVSAPAAADSQTRGTAAHWRADGAGRGGGSGVGGV